MSLNRHNPKRDDNELDITNELQRLGVQTFRSDRAGTPDLFVIHRGRWWPLEVKSAKGRLTPAQEQYHGICERTGATVDVIRDETEIPALIHKWDKLIDSKRID